MDRKAGPLFLVVMATAAIGLLLTRHQSATGDEVRYLFYSGSLWLKGKLAMSLDEWRLLSPDLIGYRFETLPILGDASGTLIGHPIYVAALLSPAAAFGLNGLRLTGLVAGLIGLLALFQAANQITRPTWAAVAVLAAALSFPLLPYWRTYWIEVFIFASISIGLVQLQKAGQSRLGDLLRSALILLIPFVHLRASVIGAALFCAYLLRVIRRTGGDIGRTLPLIGLAALFAGLLLALNLGIYGSVTGSVNTARPPNPWDAIDVIATNLVSLKGVLPYAPLWLLGYAGLVAGAARRDRFVTECGVLAAVALFTSLGVNPGEGWPGRFLVASVPMLTLGLAYWLSRMESVADLALAGVLAAFSAVSSAIFLIVPNLHLENRQADRAFSKLFDYTGLANPGLFLPVETIDTGLGRAFLCAAFVFIVLAAAGAVSRKAGFSLVALAITVMALEATRVREIPVSVAPAENGVQMRLPTRPRIASLSFGKSWEAWYVPPNLRTLSVKVDGRPGPAALIPANPIVPLSCPSRIDGAMLLSKDLDVAAEAGWRAQAFESRSIVRRLVNMVPQLQRPDQCP